MATDLNCRTVVYSEEQVMRSLMLITVTLMKAMLVKINEVLYVTLF